MMDGVVRLLQLITEHIARIFLKEMKKLSQPQVNNLLALKLISRKKLISTKEQSLICLFHSF